VEERGRYGLSWTKIRSSHVQHSIDDSADRAQLIAREKGLGSWLSQARAKAPWGIIDEDPESEKILPPP